MSHYFFFTNFDGDQKNRAQEQMEQCPICLEPIESERDRSMTRCGHLFHASCLCRSTMSNIRCPICRQSLFDSHSVDETTFYLTLLTQVLFNRSRASGGGSDAEGDEPTA